MHGTLFPCQAGSRFGGPGEHRSVGETSGACGVGPSTLEEMVQKVGWGGGRLPGVETRRSETASCWGTCCTFCSGSTPSVSQPCPPPADRGP